AECASSSSSSAQSVRMAQNDESATMTHKSHSAVRLSSSAEQHRARASKRGLDDTHDQFFRGENREQERQEWGRCGGGQAANVWESEGNRTDSPPRGKGCAQNGG